MLSKEILQAFTKLRPDLLEVEFTESMCVNILEEVGKKQEDSRGQMTDKERKLTARVDLLQEELRLALHAAEDIKALKEKATHIMGQFTKQREQTHIAEASQRATEKRTDMLCAHIEKLMKCLKMEAASKIKLAEANRRERMLCFTLTKKLDEKDAKIGHSRKLIAELKEGAYVLEGQLRLMDERFYELRMKLDAARSNQKYYVEKAQKTAKDLRKKFAVIHGPRHKLDDIVVPELPPIQDENNYNYNYPQNSSNWQQNTYNTEFANKGEEGFAEGSVVGDAGAGAVGAEFNAPPGKIRPGTAAARRSQQAANPHHAATDPHSQLRENMQLRQSANGRPTTAPNSRPKTAGARSHGASTAKKGGNVYGFQPSGNDDADIDRIITRIYNKHTDFKEMRWTPDALANLVKDETGKVTVPIPDLRPKQAPETITL